MLFSYCDNEGCKQTLKERFVGTDCEQGNDVSMSARKKDYALRKARERIEFELAKRSVDLTTKAPTKPFFDLSRDGTVESTRSFYRTVHKVHNPALLCKPLSPDRTA
jgi:hypothetical protein